jgi:hypothetical protein
MITHYTASEGGYWRPWPRNERAVPLDVDALVYGPNLKRVAAPMVPDWYNDLLLFHSLRCADGREWDCVNRWRDA